MAVDILRLPYEHGILPVIPELLVALDDPLYLVYGLPEPLAIGILFTLLFIPYEKVLEGILLHVLHGKGGAFMHQRAVLRLLYN